MFKLLGGTHHGYECGFIILQTYEGSGQGCEQTRATVRSVQSVLCVKSCVFFFLKGTGVNSLDAVENVTVNADKCKSGFKQPKALMLKCYMSPQGGVLQYIYIPR